MFCHIDTILDVNFFVYKLSHAEEPLDNISCTNKMWRSKRLCFIINLKTISVVKRRVFDERSWHWTEGSACFCRNFDICALLPSFSANAHICWKDDYKQLGRDSKKVGNRGAPTEGVYLLEDASMFQFLPTLLWQNKQTNKKSVWQ